MLPHPVPLHQLDLIGQNHGLNSEEIKELWEQADIDGNGVLDYEEFKVLMLLSLGLACMMSTLVVMFSILVSSKQRGKMSSLTKPSTIFFIPRNLLLE